MALQVWGFGWGGRKTSADYGEIPCDDGDDDGIKAEMKHRVYILQILTKKDIIVKY